MYDQPLCSLSHQMLSLSNLSLEAFLAHLLCDSRSEANQCLLLLKVPGDTNSSLPVTGRYQLSPNYAEVDHFSKAVQGDTKTTYVAQVYRGDTNTPVLLAEIQTHIQQIAMN